MLWQARERLRTHGLREMRAFEGDVVEAGVAACIAHRRTAVVVRGTIRSVAMMMRVIAIGVVSDPVGLKAVAGATLEERGQRAVREDYARE
jgi:hypothetical protein